MNLFFNPSIHELRNLIKDADPNPAIHNLVVDGDGEVLLDPDLKQPDLDINKFPFRFRLRSPQLLLSKGSQWLSYVYEFLLTEWENKMSKKLVS